VTRIAVIVPVWNDATALRASLAAIVGADDVVVVDGGSDDHSVAVARAAGARVVVCSVRQRAAQMNLGAQESSTDVLLFLHADTILPPDALTAVRTGFANDPGLAGGAFRRRFIPGSRFLRLTCALANLRGRTCGWFLGDQAMFVRRAMFEQLSGFAPLRMCEDLDFSRRLARAGRTRLLRPVVYSDDRRFRRSGAVRQSLADLATTWRFLRSRESFLEPLPEILQR
jgi:rSAM/selenodomain-associated transferase 2